MTIKKSGGSRHKAQFTISGPVEVLATGTYSGPLKDVQSTGARPAGAPTNSAPPRPSRADSTPRRPGPSRRKSSLARAHARQYKHLYPRFDANVSAPTPRKGSGSRKGSGPRKGSGSRKGSVTRNGSVAGSRPPVPHKFLPEEPQGQESDISGAMADMKLDIEKWTSLGVKTDNTRLSRNMFDANESPVLPPSDDYYDDVVSFGDYRIKPLVNCGYDNPDDEGEMMSPITRTHVPQISLSNMNFPQMSAAPVIHLEYDEEQDEGKDGPADEFDDQQVELIQAIATNLKIEPTPEQLAAAKSYRSSSVYSRATSWMSFCSDDSDDTITPASSVSGESVKSSKSISEDSGEVDQDQELAAMVWQALWAYKKPIGAPVDEVNYILAPHEHVVSRPPAKGMPPPHLHPAWPLRHSSKRVEEMTML